MDSCFIFASEVYYYPDVEFPCQQKMAPIFASIGITPQIIDDERLRTLRKNLQSTSFKNILDNTNQIITTPMIELNIERLIRLIEPWQSWTFEEQVSIRG